MTITSDSILSLRTNRVRIQLSLSFQTNGFTDIRSGQLEFTQAWKEVMDARRKQRTKLIQIHEEMRKEALTGREARKIKF